MQEIEITPFKKNDPGHYIQQELRFYEKEFSLRPHDLVWMRIWKFRQLYRKLQISSKWANLGAPSTIRKIFKLPKKINRPERAHRKIKKDRRVKKIHWMIDIPGRLFPLVYRTKKEAIRAMEIGHGYYSHFYQNSYQDLDFTSDLIEIPIGSYLWRHDITKDKNDNKHWKNFEKNYPIYTKRCKSCPNKKSYQGTCGCSLWSFIKGETTKIAWIPPHQARMSRKKALKRKVVTKPSVIIWELKL